MARLTDRQANLFGIIELAPDMPVRDIARITGFKPHQVTYDLQQLKQLGFLTRAPVLNMHAAGYDEFGVLLKLAGVGFKADSALITRLRASPFVVWIAKLGGEFNLGFSCLFSSPREFVGYLETILNTNNIIVEEKVVLMRSKITYFGKRYLLNPKQVARPLIFGRTTSAITLDSSDATLVHRLFKYGCESTVVLARNLGMAPSSLVYQLESLAKRGILCGYYYVVDPKKLGVLSYRLLLRLRTNFSEGKNIVYKYAETNFAVVSVVESTGSWDYELGLEVTSPDSANLVANTLGNLLLDSRGELTLLSVIEHPTIA